MFTRNPKEISFYGVALALTFSGIVIVGIGLAFYIMNWCYGFSFFAPSSKIIGGLIVIALGYIHLELELLRKK